MIIFLATIPPPPPPMSIVCKMSDVSILLIPMVSLPGPDVVHVVIVTLDMNVKKIQEEFFYSFDCTWGLKKVVSWKAAI